MVPFSPGSSETSLTAALTCALFCQQPKEPTGRQESFPPLGAVKVVVTQGQHGNCATWGLLCMRGIPRKLLKPEQYKGATVGWQDLDP